MKALRYAVVAAVLMVLAWTYAAAQVPPGAPIGGAGFSVGYLNSLYCALTGCTMTGTFASNTITAATSSDLAVTPASGKVVRFNAPAVASTAEDVVRFGVQDDTNGNAWVQNTTATDSVYQFMLSTYIHTTDSYSMTLRAVTGTSTGANPAILLQPCAGTANPNLCVGVETTKPLLQLLNYTTTVWTVDGNTNFNTTTFSQPVRMTDTKTVGSITLVAGTGTATVSSGCKAQCTNASTVAAAPKCAVAGTTLTATGVGTDVINYFCP